MGCSICGQEDHNRRTCPNTRTCSVCGQRGHDRRTCPAASPKPNEVRVAKADSTDPSADRPVDRVIASSPPANPPASDARPSAPSTRAVVEAVQQSKSQEPWHPTCVNKYGQILSISVGVGRVVGTALCFLEGWLDSGDSWFFPGAVGIVACVVVAFKLGPMLISPECPNCSSIAIELLNVADDGTETVSRTRADKRGGKLKDHRVRVKVEVHSYSFFKKCKECGHRWTESLSSGSETGYG